MQSLILLFFLPSCFLIKPVTQKLAYNERRSYYEQGLAVIRATDVLDYSFDGHIQLNVKLNNDTSTHKYIVDNGLNSVMSNSDVKKLRLKELTAMSAYDANNNVQAFSVFHLDSLLIGKQVYYNYGFSAGDDLASVPGKSLKNITGFIGLNILEQGVWSFDNVTGKLMIAADIDSIPADRKTIRIKLKRRYDRWFVPLTVDGVKTEAILDLGYNGTLLLSRKMIAKIKPGQLLCYYGLTNHTLAGANYDSLLYSRAGSIRFTLSKLGLQNKLVCYANTRLHLLGTGLLKNNYVTIDLGHNALYLAPLPVEQPGNTTGKTWGININRQGKYWLVTTMLKGSDAERKGIRVGDTVISVNGTRLSSAYSPDDYNQLESALSNDTYLVWNCKEMPS